MQASQFYEERRLRYVKMLPTIREFEHRLKNYSSELADVAGSLGDDKHDEAFTTICNDMCTILGAVEPTAIAPLPDEVSSMVCQHVLAATESDPDVARLAQLSKLVACASVTFSMDVDIAALHETINTLRDRLTHTSAFASLANLMQNLLRATCEHAELPAVAREIVVQVADFARKVATIDGAVGKMSEDDLSNKLIAKLINWMVFGLDYEMIVEISMAIEALTPFTEKRAGHWTKLKDVRVKAAMLEKHAACVREAAAAKNHSTIAPEALASFRKALADNAGCHRESFPAGGP